MNPLLEQRAKLADRVVVLKKTIRDSRSELARTAEELRRIEAECCRRGIGFQHIHRPGVEVTHGR